MFEVKYFDRKAYLAQSPQFYKQMAMASGFDRIFEVGPVFRAEKSYTSKHTTEFTGFDLEFSYIDSYPRRDEDGRRSCSPTPLKAVKEAVRRGHRSAEFGPEVIVPDRALPGGQAGRPVRRVGKGIRLHRARIRKARRPDHGSRAADAMIG